MTEAPADASWFVIEGPAESALDPNTTKVVGVRLQPPADAPAGEYLFHLLVYSTAAPGQDFTEGPKVAVRVTPPKPKPEPEKLPESRPWWWIVAAAIAVVLVGGLLTWAFWPKASKTDFLIPYGDAGKGEGFAGLLAGEGFAVEKLDCDNLEKLPDAAYRVLLIGPDTGRCWSTYGRTSRGAFYSALSLDVRERLQSSRLLALGEGGYDLLGGLQSRIGSPKGWHGSKMGVYLTSQELAKDAGLPTRKPVSLCTESRHVGIHDQDPAFEDAGVIALGREPDNDTHWTIAHQDRWITWGYTEGPSKMTEAGRKLFIAVGRYALR